MDELVNAWVGDRDTPFQLGLVGVFDPAPFRRPDGSLDVPRVRRELVARAGRVPALRRRVVWTRPGEGRPVWAADPCFDPAAHVEAVTLPTPADWTTWAANRVVRPLARHRPLWRAEIVDGVPDGRFAVIIVVHHLVTDGLAGMALASSLLDTAPDAARPAATLGEAQPLPSHRDLLRARLAEIAAVLRRRRNAPPGEVRGRPGLRQAREAMAGLRTPLPATSLPTAVGPDRRMVVVRQPLADLVRAGHALGVTVNDLLLTAVTGGLRELLSRRGEPTAGLVLRTTVPAATGRPGQVLGMLVVDLPVGEPDALRCLERIHRTTSQGKARLRASGADVSDLLRVPLPVARAIVRYGRRYGSRRITAGVTDVIGPPAPLWLAGARLLEAVPVAPLVPLVPLSVAALSYAGQFAVSVNADASITDLGVLGDGLARTFDTLRDTRTASG